MIPIPINQHIQGELFAWSADYLFKFYDHTQIELYTPHSVVYTDTHWAKYLFPLMPKDLNVKVVCHNSDAPFDDDLAKLIPEKVHVWTQNCAVEHPRVHPLPIGLENNRWFPEELKRAKLYHAARTPVYPTKTAYLACNPFTNPPSRIECFDYFSDKSWCTSIRSQNGPGYDEYLNSILEHQFIISPEGNGIDCHRTWEALYLHRVPIVQRRPSLYGLWQGLPVIEVDSWQQVYPKYLKKQSLKFADWCAGDTTGFNVSKLTIDYWLNAIKETKCS